MDTGLLQRFTQLIATHTGIQIREEETDKLCQTIRSRMVQEQLTDPEAYYRLLAIDAATGRREWEELIPPLTIGETFFFRDSGQLSLSRIEERRTPSRVPSNYPSQDIIDHKIIK